MSVVLNHGAGRVFEEQVVAGAVVAAVLLHALVVWRVYVDVCERAAGPWAVVGWLAMAAAVPGLGALAYHIVAVDGSVAWLVPSP